MSLITAILAQPPRLDDRAFDNDPGLGPAPMDTEGADASFDADLGALALLGSLRSLGTTMELRLAGMDSNPAAGFEGLMTSMGLDGSGR
jgi:hypothetical protein